MSKEPDDLILKMLREMRAERGDVREGVSDLNEKFGAMRKEIREGQEAIATTAGFAMHANLRGQRLEEEIADLKRRAEMLEKA
jgi:predicted  nucleic acid-binding Zn-ribbon protein